MLIKNDPVKIVKITDGREKEREIKKGKYHGKKKEVPEMRTQECQIILFHLKFCLERWCS